MGTFNFYPEFVADQVLTADHLNELFDYLDEQDRLTRRCLIGIGIVCGLEVTLYRARNPHQPRCRCYLKRIFH